MKKKIMLACIIVLSLALTGSVAYALFSSRMAEPYEIHHRSEDFDGIYERTPEENIAILKSHERPASEELITCIYPEGEILRDIVPSSNIRSAYGRYMQTPSIFGHYPVDNVRWVDTPDGGHYYAVWMTEKGARYYLFFDREGTAYGHPIYAIGKTHSYQEFSMLKEGDRIEKVIKIDPSTKAYYESFQNPWTDKSVEEQNKTLRSIYNETGSWPLTSMHLLTDGLLEIRYEYTSRGYAIARMEYSPDFKGIEPTYDLSKGWEISEEEREMYREYAQFYNFTILQKDYLSDIAVVANIEAISNEPKAYQDVKWEMTIIMGDGNDYERRTVRQEDIPAESVETFLVSRLRNGNPQGPVETVFVGGVPVKWFAGSEEGTWSKAYALFADGTEMCIENDTKKQDAPYVVWIQNKNYALDGTDTGLALVTKGEDMAGYHSSLTGLRFVP